MTNPYSFVLQSAQSSRHHSGFLCPAGFRRPPWKVVLCLSHAMTSQIVKTVSLLERALSGHHGSQRRCLSSQVPDEWIAWERLWLSSEVFYDFSINAEVILSHTVSSKTDMPTQLLMRLLDFVNGLITRVCWMCLPESENTLGQVYKAYDDVSNLLLILPRWMNVSPLLVPRVRRKLFFWRWEEWRPPEMFNSVVHHRPWLLHFLRTVSAALCRPPSDARLPFTILLRTMSVWVISFHDGQFTFFSLPVLLRSSDLSGRRTSQVVSKALNF